MTEILDVQNLTFSYGAKRILEMVSFGVSEGEMLTILGPNGSGKSTMLKLISGLLSPSSGSVLLDGKDVSKISRQDLAHNIAVLPQEVSMPFSFNVEDVVMLGRTAYVSRLGSPSRADREAVEAAIEMAECSSLIGRVFTELSGGEKQSVILAMALAQETRILLLDEPTLHLDIRHQLGLFELVTRLSKNIGLTVISVLHDINLASLFFPRVLMLHEGRVLADGEPCRVITTSAVRKVFGVNVQVQIHPLLGVPQVLPVLEDQAVYPIEMAV